jgi:uncharacterized protein
MGAPSEGARSGPAGPNGPGGAAAGRRSIHIMDTDADGLGVLTRPEAVALVKTREVGRLVYTSRALPAVMPVNYAMRDGGILIWTGSASALSRSLRGAVVAFQVDDLDYVARSGWSVTVTGMSRLVVDGPTLKRARTAGPVPWTHGAKDHLICIPLTLVTGRWLGTRKHAAAEYPDVAQSRA